MRESWNRGERLPQRSADPLPILITQKGSNPLVVLSLGETFYGDLCHYEGMTLPHVKDGPCWVCDRTKHKPKWQGYLAVYETEHKVNRVLAFPDGAGRQLMAFLVQFGSLRGCKFELRRKDPEQRNSKLLVSLIERVPTDRLRPEFDPMPSVRKLLGVNEAYYLSESYRHREEPARVVKSTVPMPTGPVNPLSFWAPKGVDQ